jgi:hypothetical protein
LYFASSCFWDASTCSRARMRPVAPLLPLAALHSPRPQAHAVARATLAPGRTLAAS